MLEVSPGIYMPPNMSTGVRRRVGAAMCECWQGVLVGTPIDGSRKGNMLTGNARLTFDSRQQQIDATFSGIFDMTIGAPHTFANVRCDNIPVRANGTY